MKTTVAIVEDNGVICTSLERVIAASPDLRCLGASRNAEHALRTLPRLAPEVVLMDIELPGLSGIECTVRLKQLLPSVRVLILTVYKDPDQIFRALQAGASGYLLKRSSAGEILQAVRDVKAGGAPMTAEIAAKVVQSFHKPAAAAASGRVQSLTPREAEVLGLLAQGYVAKEIADRLAISYETVRDHLAHIYEKLHVRSRTEAVIQFFQQG